jgi:hypothetical protein
MIGKVLPIQFALIVNLIQMKSMKVNDTPKNIMNQEFQHCSESQLSEVMNVKMHAILFTLNLNSTQRKLNEISWSHRKSLDTSKIDSETHAREAEEDWC